MIKSTWHEEPEKRPSFTKVVQFLHEHVGEDTPVDKADGSAHVDAENDSGYLDLFQAQTVIDT